MRTTYLSWATGFISGLNYVGSMLFIFLVVCIMFLFCYVFVLCLVPYVVCGLCILDCLFGVLTPLFTKDKGTAYGKKGHGCKWTSETIQLYTGTHFKSKGTRLLWLHFTVEYDRPNWRPRKKYFYVYVFSHNMSTGIACKCLNTSI